VPDTATLLRNSAEVATITSSPSICRRAVWFEADENHIRQILWNLATNGCVRWRREAAADVREDDARRGRTN
jgi:hypothetical protein